jgi:hypothetical protein
MALVSMPALSQCLGVRWIIIDIAIETLVDVVVEILQSFFPVRRKLKEQNLEKHNHLPASKFNELEFVLKRSVSSQPNDRLSSESL